MRHSRWAISALLLLILHTAALKLHAAPPLSGNAGSPTVNLANLPLAFEPGSAGDDYLTRSGSMQARFSPSGMRFLLPSVDSTVALETHFTGANPQSEIFPFGKTGESNYLIGVDSTKWRTHVPQYSRLQYRDVYPGVDLVYYGTNGRIEHDFIVKPGADYRIIRMQYTGQRSIRLTQRGDLVLEAGASLISIHAPHIYQEQDGRKIDRSGQFILKDNEASFAIADYDHTLPLIIDPVLDYATYLADQDLHVNGAAVDAAGNTYIVGLTFYQTYPVTSGALQTTCTSCAANKPDTFITKLNADGTAQIYSTFLGGSDYDEGLAISVDAHGNAAVVGYTASSDFPLKNAVPAGVPTSQDGFVASIAPDGASLNFSSRLGGGTAPSQGTFTLIEAVTTDAVGNVYVAGSTESPFIPQTAGALNAGTPDYSDGFYFLTKLSPAGNLLYGAVLGQTDKASECCTIANISTDAQGNAFLAGSVGSDDDTGETKWPTTPGAYQSKSLTPGNASPFVAKVASDGSKLLYSTLAGTGVVASAALDAAQEFVLAGTGAANLPTTADALDALPSQSFLEKVSADGTQLLYASYFGNSRQGQSDGQVYLTSVALDGAGNVWLAGNDGDSNNVPLAFPLQSIAGSTGTQRGTAFASEFDATLHNLLFSTYFNGNQSGSRASALAIDATNRIHFVGTGMDDLPTTPSAFLGSVTPPPPDYTYQFGFAALIDPAGSSPGLCLSGDLSSFATLGSSYQGNVNITDCGTATLVINSVQITGPGFSLPSPAVCDTAIAPGQTCALPTLFTPTVAQISYGELTISSNALVKQTIATLYGTSQPANGPAVTLSAQNIDFGSVQVGASSDQQMLTLTNVGNAPLTASFKVTGDFSEINTCTSTNLANGGCTIFLTFSPTVGGSRTGALTITSNAAGSPQVVPLTGNGLNVLSVASSTPALSVSSAGQTATTAIQITSQNGFAGTATLSCSVQYMGQGTANHPPTCSLSPTQVQISSTGPVSSMLTVSTIAASSSATVRAGLCWFTGIVVVFAFAPRRRIIQFSGIVLIASGVTMGLLGCGGSSSNTGGGGNNGGTPAPITSTGTTPGTYQIVVTATSGSAASTVTIAFSVN